MLKRMLIVVPVILALAGALFAGKGNIDLTGNWVLDKEASKNLEGEAYLLVSIQIKQMSDSLATERTYELGYGDRYPFTENFVLDGKENKHYIYEMPRTISAMWSKDGKSVTTNISGTLYTDSGDVQYKSSETWKLQDEGSTLIIEAKSAMPEESDKRTLVYKQQKD